MTDPEQDEVFDAYLKRRPVLPALDEKLEPPAALDERVLSQAREAIRSERAAVGGGTADVGGDAGGDTTPLGAAKRPPRRPPRWAVPMALAATILLCLSVVMNISLNTNRPSPNLARMTAARADVKTSALANATAESDAAAGVSAPAAARDALAANNGERRESVSGDIPSHEVVLPRAKVAGTPAPHAPVVAEAAPGPSASGSAFEQKAESAAAGAANRAPGALGDVSRQGGAVPTAPSAADKAVLMAKEAGVAAPEYTPAPEQERATASVRKAAKAAKAAVAAAHPADPKVWLQQIDALRAAGKIDQADAEMQRFKAAFPNYRAPAAGPDLPK